MDKGTANRSAAVGYVALLAVQTLVATFLLWITVPIFRHVVSGTGEPLGIDADSLAAIIVGAVILQCCHWIRFYRVPVCVPFHSVVVAHLLIFASRASFFFSGALFSAVFFRYIPELAAFPPIAVGLARITALFGVLFALFCYSLELERLGRGFGDLR